MATLYFAVFADAKETAKGPALQFGAVTIGGTSTQSSAIVGSERAVRRVRLFADALCFVHWGANPTAVNNGTAGIPLGTENPEYIDVEAEHKIAVITRM